LSVTTKISGLLLGLVIEGARATQRGGRERERWEKGRKIKRERGRGLHEDLDWCTFILLQET
jgi:hypothetical protein